MSIPENWVTNKMPSRDWITAFLKRNTSFSLRKPETAKIKAMSFNKTNVQEFYTKLAKILDQYKFAASAIWNADETCVSTVSKLPKKTANKEKEHVAVDKPTGECGTNVTVLVAVSATGSFIPPMFIFPCEKFEERFIQDGPTDCIGAGNPSGCLTHDDFFMYMQHFIKQVKASKESPVLLILNNNSSSYISVPTLDLAEENGVIMLSIPRHCSQKMQPLDVGVYALLRTYMPSAKVAWMQNNAGKMMTIYDIPEIVRTALPLALEPNNIVSGFEKTGVFPCNENKFSDADYVSCPMEEDKNETSNMEQPSTSTFSLLHNILSGFEKAGIFPDNQNKFDIADDFAMNPTENEPQPSTSTSGLLPNAPQPSTSLNPQEPTSSETEVETIEVLIDPLELFSEK
ncbi:uncharacterized protein LOC113386420 [Ctenocephalides felis]|uniref:uncharacterized protein LOC113386420 n=1 Tax=Ctenocephalides felis TaxID=7515 RepID=UPI000E6E1767|nr:uncharacterized protein LOC113386420 [Ctenocephalides felis]